MYSIMYCEAANLTVLIHVPSGSMHTMKGAGQCELQLARPLNEMFIVSKSMAPEYCHKFFRWSETGKCVGPNEPQVKKSKTVSPSSEPATPMLNKGHDLLNISTKRSSLTACSLKFDVLDTSTENDKNIALRAFDPVEKDTQGDTQEEDAQVDEPALEAPAESLLPPPDMEPTIIAPPPVSPGDIPSSPEDESQTQKQPLPGQEASSSSSAPVDKKPRTE